MEISTTARVGWRLSRDRGGGGGVGLQPITNYRIKHVNTHFFIYYYYYKEMGVHVLDRGLAGGSPPPPSTPQTMYINRIIRKVTLS